MPRETMTSRERWLAVLRRETPDRVPMDYWATPEATRKLMRHLGCRTRRQALDRLHVDYVVSVGPRYCGPRLAPRTDVFGCRYRRIAYATGSYDEVVSHPLARFDSVEEIEAAYRWPSPDWWDYREIPSALRAGETHPVRAGGSEPFLIYKNLRGQEQALIDLIERPEIVRYCMGRLFDLAYESTRRIFETIPGRVTMTYVAEDMGGQSGLLFSPRQIRAFLLPGMKRMIDLSHEAGAYVFHHNDGNIRAILPDLVELGIDLLNPIQWRADGMDRAELKRAFGARLVLHGAMDNQQTLPFGTVQDVRREVLDNLEILGAGGGYILAPCHNIQAVGPAENVVAMYEACYEHGWT